MEIEYDLSRIDEKRLKDATVSYLKGMDFDDETACMIANTGVDNLKENIEELIKLLNGGELQKAADAAHTVKGILWNMGLQEEGMLFKKLQLAILDGKPVEEVVQLLEDALDTISKE
ncbi:Hpt domain-containing protein [Desulfurobacterium atlanticum]|uniref:Hpt domain-containing protein n=1 Tax=Desulfurobacterium atlanticum TaxID=240169 RepID=A0A238YNK2_9BACT|nr:Hpt domain-containing protein [Desulfurobacterium atlanticum]SNR72009.1 Hpt domain-containing protein [Desulfurobacterium atlanticum]